METFESYVKLIRKFTDSLFRGREGKLWNQICYGLRDLQIQIPSRQPVYFIEWIMVETPVTKLLNVNNFIGPCIHQSRQKLLQTPNMKIWWWNMFGFITVGKENYIVCPDKTWVLFTLLKTCPDRVRSAEKVDWWHKIERLSKEADDTANKILLWWTIVVEDGMGW